MNQQPKYKFYATLLDSFQNYLDSYDIWEKYWGWSENPPHTPEEFMKQQERDLIDRINRVPFESYDADRGTVFNELVDACIENRQPNNMTVERVTDEKTGTLLYHVDFKDQEFWIPVNLVLSFYKQYKDNTISQKRVEGIIDTIYGDVFLYGYIDELMPFSVHDIKTTKSYSFPKFKKHWQHLVYPYCLQQEGINIDRFDYDVTDWKNIFVETYIYDPKRDKPLLREICEQLIDFLEEHRDEITDKKIFAQDDPED